jgi:hypothetical protein
MTDHHLAYAVLHRKGRVGGFQAACACGHFHAWIEDETIAGELALLELHVFHVDHPELGT